MNEIRTEAMLQALESQRNAALRDNVILHAALAETVAQVKQLTAEIETLKKRKADDQHEQAPGTPG